MTTHLAMIWAGVFYTVVISFITIAVKQTEINGTTYRWVRLTRWHLVPFLLVSITITAVIKLTVNL